MRRILLLFLSGIVLGVVACESSGVSLGKYLAEMDSLRARLEDEQTARQTELEAIHEDGVPLTEEERATHDRERILYFVRVVGETKREVEKVEPANVAKKAHEDYITAIAGFAAAFEATLADDTYQELFFPPDRRPSPELTHAQNEDSIMSFSAVPSLREAETILSNACGELRGIAFSNYENHPEDGILERPC